MNRHQMKTDASFDGCFVRTATTSNEFIFVVEPMDEGSFFQLAPLVTEIKITGANMTSFHLDEFENLCGEWIQITFSNGVATVETEQTAKQILACSNVTATKRDYETQDLWAKFVHLSRIFKSTEETSGKLIQELSEKMDAILKYTISHHHTCTLKRDFFTQKNLAKAKEYDAKLDVLNEIKKIMKHE